MKIHRRFLLSIAFIGFLTLTIAPVVKATPYACEVTNVSGNIQFYLGESANDVTVIFDSGAVTNDLGALATGLNSFPLSTHTNYQIVVSKAGAGAITQISVDATNNSFFGPRGVAVNRNPQSSFFGRIYCVNASPGTGNSPGRASGKGVYVLNADTSDCLGFGNTAAVPTGMTLGGSTTYSPYKPFVGTDNSVYIGNADGIAVSVNPPGNGLVWLCDPNLTTASSLVQTNIPRGQGSSIISTPCAVGSLAAGNLTIYCNMWGYAETNALNVTNYTGIFNFPIGGGPLPYQNDPQTNTDFGGNANNLVGGGVVADLYIAPDGKFYEAQDRNSAVGGAAGGNVSLWVYAADGQTYLWDSSSANGGVDPFTATYGVAVSPDDKYVACVNGTTGGFEWAQLTNGIPDISTVQTNLTGMGGTTRGIAFDAGDNVYIISGGNDRLRVYSLGLTTTCVTSNDVSGTNGSFSITVPNATASVVAITNQASQVGPVPGVFQITRSGGNTNLALTVSFTFGGTAAATNYTVSPAGLVPGAANTITIAAGQLSTNITITPVVDSTPRPTITVVLSLRGGTSYSAVPPTLDTVNIASGGSQFVFISGTGAPSMYKAFSNDYASFTVTRWGNTNMAAYVASGFTFAGTAVEGTDFEGTNGTAPAVTINPGDITDTVFLSPLINGQIPVDTNIQAYTGNKTIVVGYSGNTNTATLTIIDNANPPATVLYSDPLSTMVDSNNWLELQSNDNMHTNAVDSYVDFGYDLYDDPRDPQDQGNAIPIPFPPNGATNSLRLTVNKSPGTGSANGAAGAVNLYLTNFVCSGNYQVTFNMNLVEGFNASYTTEGALFGINHTGMATNWFAGSTIRSGWGAADSEVWQSDGIWTWISVDNGIGAFNSGPSSYMTFTGVGGALPNTGFALPSVSQLSSASVANNFKTNVFTTGAGPGLAANESPDVVWENSLSPSLYGSWSDVTIRQYNNVVRLMIDKTLIYAYTNTTSFTNGYLMLGYEDPYDSVGGGDAAVYFSNLKITALGAPAVSNATLNHSNNTLVFTFSSPDATTTASSFTVVGAATINGPYTAIAGATITQGSNGTYLVTVPQSGNVHFYRLQQTL